jgi:glycosyltransferase involved in cell wall biosynthesis
LPQIYADLDCSVLCSINEGLPVAVIEALAAARPVVACEVGGVADLVRHEQTGYLARPGDAADVARGIEAALCDGRGAAWGRAGRAHVFPALDISRLVSDIERLYDEALAAKDTA